MQYAAILGEIRQDYLVGLDDSQLDTRLPAKGPDPEALQRWGPFEQLQLVGRGSFGEVYRAFDPALQRHVALKLLIPRGLAREAQTLAVLREARALAKLRHPNIVPVYGVDRHAGRVGFWTDFVRGATLARIIHDQGPMGAREAALIGLDVCRAVGALHGAGLVHRDIKAGNIMREEGGRILLMDFGLSHEQGGGDLATGTPLYMAPELFEGMPATVASDIFAIGVLLFNLLTTDYPVSGADETELRLAHRRNERRSLLDLRPDLPEALVVVVETAIHPQPQQRFPSAGRMAVALADAAGLAAAITGSTTETAPSVSTPASPVRKLLQPWVLAAAAGVVIAALFLVVPWLRSAFTQSPPLAAVPQAGVEDEYRRAHELLQHYYRPGAVETAMPILESLAAKNPDFAPAFADLARANLLQFIQQRDTKYIEPTRTAALRALALAPEMASPHVTLGALYARTSQNELATHELDEALKLDRFNAAAYGALAELYVQQGRNDQVEATLKKAVSLAPDDWSLVQQLGEHYLDNARWEEAGAQYRRAAELAPDNPRAHNNLGLVYRGLDQLDASAASFRKAIDLEPTFLRYRNLGMVLAESGRYDEAVPMLQRSIDMRPEHYRAWGLLGLVYLNQHVEEAKVRETLLKAITLAADLREQTPNDEYLLADVGGYYAALKMEKESAPLLAQAAALAPETPEVLYQVAVGYEMINRREEALALLEKAIARGYPATAIARNPQLTALRADRRFARDSR
jgi:serine/threonine protein kinase/Tfp pilus assembly protein PilF